MDRWDKEPDRLDFKAHGLKCAMRRNGLGAWCGYVRVGEDHPLHNVKYSTPHESLSGLMGERMDRPVGDAPGMAVMLGALSGTIEASAEAAIDVHGGITFSGKPAGTNHNDPGWWFGFDCSHYGDLTPKIDFAGDGTYRTAEYVRSETEKLAEQLQRIAATPAEPLGPIGSCPPFEKRNAIPAKGG